jgi:inhibitor of Bruton tyrosine kinase
MSGYLWKAFLEDDVACFRAVLDSASYTSRGTGRGQLNPGSFKDALDRDGTGAGGVVLTRTDLNYRDDKGRTLLHLVASSRADSALSFARALLELPLLDIDMQD